jgi:hypothetical protein
MKAADVVERPIVGLAHDGVDRPDVLAAGLLDRISASTAVPTLRVLVRMMGVSMLPSSRTWEYPASFPNPLKTWIAAGAFCRKILPPWGRTAVTPVRTESPLIIVTWPTRTPATSVMAFKGPVGITPVVSPNSRGLGRAALSALAPGEGRRRTTQAISRKAPRKAVCLGFPFI